MITKFCGNCQTEKPVEEFFKDRRNVTGYMSKCKVCKKSYHSLYEKNNKEKLREYQRERSPNRKGYRKAYRNRPYVKEKERELNKTNITYRLRKGLRHRLRQVIKQKSNTLRTEDLVGCSLSFLKKHLESQFTEGMSWDNYGVWHVDHIKPCCMFNLFEESQKKECFHYTNLQPLWGEDNCKKGGTFPSNSSILKV
jgi:hypothetical protein